MSRSFRLLLSLPLITLLAACGKQPEKTAGASTPAESAATAKLETVDQRVSYGIGHNLGSKLVQDKVLQLDREALKAGLAEGLAQTTSRVTEQEMETAFNALNERAQAQAAAAAEKQLAEGQAYLDKNKAKSGVTVTASGLQYEVIKSGTGAKPTPTNTVKVHYHGTLIDGTVFDSSVERNEPIEFPVTGVIPGWVEALQLMSVGDKWKLTIPANLAYGPRSTGKIPGNSVLLFEVELLEVK